MSSRLDVFQERHCLTWKTDIIEHKVREINFGPFKLLLEIQPQICRSVVYIFLYDKGKSGAKFNTRTYVLNKDRKEIFEQLYKGCLKNGPTLWSLERDELLSNEDNFLGERIITFGFEISPYEEIIVLQNCDPIEKDSESTEKKNPSCLEMMSLDFGKLLDIEEGSDVVLKCADQHIKSHRYILSARSDVFAAMFRSDMLENQKGVVTIKDMAPETLERMLRYIYSTEVEELTVETASKLYKAADQYGIGTLKDRCASFLKENLSQISACDIVLLANIYNDEQLENAAMNFIVENCASLRTDQWNKFCEEHPSLAIKVYRKYTHEQAQRRHSDKNCAPSASFGFAFGSTLVQPNSGFGSSIFTSFGTAQVITEPNVPLAVEEKESPSLEKMSLDFGKLFDNEEGSDVVLECVEEQVKAHTYILSARSDVFAAMFRSDMENLKGIVTIQDVTPEICEQMLRYIYSGKVENLTVETASELYKAADHYVIGSLKNRCVSFLKENLSEISACKILVLADTYNDERLESSVTDFMVKNFHTFFRTDEWDKFCKEHPPLGIRVYQKYVNKQPESSTGLRFKPY